MAIHKSVNDYGIATKVLTKAAEAIERGADNHGNTYKSFEMIGQMWSTYISHAMTSRSSKMITPFDVATMMMMVKQARSLYGEGMDNQVDAAGYAALAAMLNPVPNLDGMKDELSHAVHKSIKSDPAI